MFSGTYTALVTPFRNDTFDSAAFTSLIETQIAGGVDGIVPVGTTGESPTLDHDEHLEVIAEAVKAAKGRTKVIAGTGSNSTSEAIALTVAAEKAGADAALLVAPYYNKPSQEGLFLHYSKIAEASKLPIILYSIPGRCGIEIGTETVKRLAKACPTIVAIKEAGGSVERVNALRHAIPDSFDILSGDDSLTLPFIAAGARGVVSVASNIAPKEISDMVKAALEGDFATARATHERYYTFFKELFVEPNPVPIKFALASKGLMAPDVRLPLCPMSVPNQHRLTAILKAIGLAS
ncbi:MAG TPA: 4-hydroxy-tetrahydrodipicolinate synthase [Chthoniobacteraceae bacterium]|nr:4-hydroxy-tetrahydrodipicolinate synthase [Chthoniobacteraceae bacterium]